MEDFDIFLSYNKADEDLVECIARKLQAAGLRPWLDKWNLVPGESWQTQIGNALRDCATFGILLGQNGLGDWAREEVLALDRLTAESRFRLIPILLPGAPDPFDFNRLPPFLIPRTCVDLRRGLEGKESLQALIAAIRGLPPGGPHISPAWDEKQCPYRGLEIFDEDHAELFFGRERDVQRLLEKLKTTRFLAILGASGSGKTSLVRAGFIPALKRGALPRSETWDICKLRPGSRPLTTLAAHLLTVCPAEQTIQTAVAQMAQDQRALHLAVTFSLARARAGKKFERVVWVIDQFEEVFALCNDEKERNQFIANLLYASSTPSGQCTLVLTMRADFLPKCTAFPDLATRVADHQFLVGPMAADMLRLAIEEPAKRSGLAFEPGLVDMILNDVASEAGGLPLLEHALLELWKRRRDHTITFEGYGEFGGARGAIVETAEETFKSFSPHEQAILRRIMMRLTKLGEGTEDMAHRAAITELVTGPDEAFAVERVVRAMTDARLLTITSGELLERCVAISHEALIRGWPRLRQWLDEDRAGLRLHRAITEAAEVWRRSDRHYDFLLRGARLAQALEWRERNESEPNFLEREFLNASVALKHRLEQEEKEQQNALVSWLSRQSQSLGLSSLVKKCERRMREMREMEKQYSELLTESARLMAQKTQLQEKISSLKEDIIANAPQVFLSYAHEDAEAATSLYDALRQNGIRAWLDKRDLAPGSVWELEIRKAIRKADFIVICVSKRSINKRGYVQREIKLALDTYQAMPTGEVFLMPARLEVCEVPEEISAYQYCDLFTKDGLERLADAILTHWAKRTKGLVPSLGGPT